jgi:hypothetical protein
MRDIDAVVVCGVCVTEIDVCDAAMTVAVRLGWFGLIEAESEAWALWMSDGPLAIAWCADGIYPVFETR